VAKQHLLKIAWSTILLTYIFAATCINKQYSILYSKAAVYSFSLKHAAQHNQFLLLDIGFFTRLRGQLENCTMACWFRNTALGTVTARSGVFLNLYQPELSAICVFKELSVFDEN